MFGANDLDVFFADFGEDAMLAGKPVRGNFTCAWSPQRALGLSVGATESTFEVKASDVPPAWHGLTLAIATGAHAGSYTVTDWQPDGTGLGVLVLERVA